MIYCKNKKFLDLLITYQQTQDRKIANEIGKIFLTIASRFAHKANFIDYTEDRKDEMISDAVYYMWRFIDKFETTKDNPFSYFTTVAKNAFLQYIKSRKKYDEVFTNINYVEYFNNNNSIDE